MSSPILVARLLVRKGQTWRYHLPELPSSHRPVAGEPDSIVVGQDWNDDVRVILFAKLAEGVEFNEDLIKKIKDRIRENTTPRHVPAKVIAVGDIPYTMNGKKVELAVKQAIHNQPILNKEVLVNPEVLDLYKDIKELQTAK